MPCNKVFFLVLSLGFCSQIMSGAEAPEEAGATREAEAPREAEPGLEGRKSKASEKKDYLALYEKEVKSTQMALSAFHEELRDSFLEVGYKLDDLACKRCNISVNDYRSATAPSGHYNHLESQRQKLSALMKKTENSSKKLRSTITSLLEE